MAESPYQTIKRHIAQAIAAGHYATGAVLPSEHALCRDFSVSRMTVNRAMRELAQENLVRRVPGVGTFVAEPVPRGELIEIRNIADEIRARGHAHKATVLALKAAHPGAEICAAFGLGQGAVLFQSLLVHAENDVPIQLEARFVNPALAPAYLDQDFAALTPNAYLTRVAPIEEVEHLVQAGAADAEAARYLHIKQGAACLVVTRRTWSGGQMAALTTLTHPGDRFVLTGRFIPVASELNHDRSPA